MIAANRENERDKRYRTIEMVAKPETLTYSRKSARKERLTKAPLPNAEVGLYVILVYEGQAVLSGSDLGKSLPKPVMSRAITRSVRDLVSNDKQ